MKSTVLRFKIRLIAMVMAILMVVMAIPANAFSENPFITSNDSEAADTSTEKQTSNTAKVTANRDVYEITSLREESVKHFRNEDGSYVAVQYDTPVHRKDAEDKWVDIDNTLSASLGEYKANDTRLSFAQKTNDGKNLFTLTDSDYKIEMNIEAARSPVSASVTNPQEKKALSKSEDETPKSQNKLEELIKLDKLTSRIVYNDIFGDTDIEYILVSNDVKENIIVKSKKDSYNYTFAIKLTGLFMQMSEGGDINIYDSETEKLVYIIPRGYMYDAVDEYSDAVTYTLTDKESGSYVLEISADSDWINSKDRVFPVTIDPTISVPNTSVIDLDIDSTRLDHSSPNDDTLNVCDTWRTYWKTTALPSLPSSAYIISSTISLFATWAPDSYVGVYKVTTSWDTTLTWRKTTQTTSPQGVMSNTVLDYNKIEASYDQYDFDITSLVKSWYSGDTQNYGVGFKIVEGTSCADKAKFLSINDVDTLTRPKFTVTYRDMKGLESYWSYTPVNAGLAGTGYVNNATGDLTFTKPLISTSDSIMTYTPTLVYNSSLANKEYEYPNAQTSYIGTYMPYGFKMNIQETLIKKKYYDVYGNNKYYYIYADADGTEHSFYEDQNTANTYRDEDGLQQVLTISGDTCTIKDNSQTERIFSRLSTNAGSDVYGGWYLTTIKDKYNNRTVFEFDTGKRPIHVNFIPNGYSTISYLDIMYTADYLPYVVWNTVAKEAVILKYSQTPQGEISTSNTKYLRQIIYAHGTPSVTANDWTNYYTSGTTTNITVDRTVTYTYTTSGKLSSAMDDKTGYKVSYSYNGNKIVLIRESATSSTGQKLRFDYTNGCTQIRSSGTNDNYGDSDDTISIYTFDSEGRLSNTYATDSQRHQLYSSSSGEYEQYSLIKNNIKSTNTTSEYTENYLLNGGFEKLDSNNNALYWTKSGDLQYQYSTGGVQYGNRTVHVDISNSWGSLSQRVKLSQGTYTLSAAFSMYNAEGATVYMTAISLDDSSRRFNQTIPICLTQESLNERTFSLTFTANDHDAGYERFLIVIFATGDDATADDAFVEFDNVNLEKTVGVGNPSLVEMGGFESYAYNPSTSVSTFWKDESNGYTGASLSAPFATVGKVNSSVTSEKYLKQTVYSIYNSAGSIIVLNTEPERSRTYVLSGYGKANSITCSSALFGLRAEVYYYNAGSNTTTSKTYRVGFNKDCTDWQFVQGEIVTDNNSCISKIDIYCEYSYQPTGYALFDNISFVLKDNQNITDNLYYGQTIDYITDEYQYSENLYGLLRKKEVGNYIEYYEYNNDRNMTRFANNRGVLIDYIYEGNKLTQSKEYTFRYLNSKYYPFSKEDPDSLITKTHKLTTDYGYTVYGNLLTTTICEIIEGTASGKSIYTSNSYYNYTNYFGVPKYTTDSLGYTTRYFYDIKGRKTAELDVTSGYGVCYTYNAAGDLTSTKPATYNSISDTYSAVYNVENVVYGYNTKELLTNISTQSTDYGFTYDSFGNVTEISTDYGVLASYEYNDNNGKLKEISYGNGTSLRYVYNTLENVSEIWYNNGAGEEKAYEYTYTVSGQLFKVNDLRNNKCTVYNYDQTGKLLGSVDYDSGTMIDTHSTLVFYDEAFGRPDSVYTTFSYESSQGTAAYGIQTYLSYNEYKDRTDVYRISEAVDNSYIYTSNYSYDKFERLDHRTDRYGNGASSFEIETSYEYVTNTDDTSVQIEKYTTEKGEASTETEYTYDSRGNIIKAKVGTLEYRYVYDDLGQLIREDNPAFGKTYVYTYDNSGNRLTKKIYSLTAQGVTPTSPTQGTGYAYNNTQWKDLLTVCQGHTITYDGIGNPLSYYNGTSYTFTWKDGRRLASAVKGSNTYSFEYNDEGIRTGKTVNGVKHEYYLNGNQILAEKWGNELLVYLYDAEGSPIGMKYRYSSMSEGVFHTYWFEKNMQGDIIAVYNSEGIKLYTYTYDAWGNFTQTCHYNYGNYYYATYNPFRYRGYYYDTDLGMYYLQSRYYDCNTGRFINADGYINANGDIIGYNMFAYCSNNPLNFVDPSGEGLLGLFVAAVLLFTPIGGMALQIATSVVSYAGIAVASIFDEEIRSDMNSISWNPFNSDEEKTCNSNKVSFYEGVPVFKTSCENGSMSLGAIFLNNQDTDVLKHERGHSTQLMSMGLGNYLIQIGIPSVWKNNDNNPWELSASILGNSGLVSNASSEQIRKANRYYRISCIPIVNTVNIYEYLFKY